MTESVVRRVALPVVLVVLLGATLSAAGSVVASPQPTPVCPTCGVQFERAASEAGTAVSVTDSEVDVHLRADGSARWTTRTTVDDASAESLTQESAHDIVTEALDRHRLVEPGDPEVRLDGRTLTATYTADVATTRAGVLLVDAFQRGVTDWWVVNADRFTIHAPDGYALANDPDGSTTETDVTFVGTSQERFPDASITGDTMLAFTPADTGAAGVRASVAIAAYNLPAAIDGVVRNAAIPTLLLALVVLIYPRLGVETAAADVDTDQFAALTIGAVATLLGAVLVSGVAWFGVDATTTVLAAGFGVLATTLAARYPARTTLRGLVVAASLGLLAFAASNAIVTATSTAIEGVLGPTVSAILLAIPVVVLLPLGYADATESPYARHLRVVLVAAPTLFVASRVTMDDPYGLLTLLLATYGLLVAVLGVVPYWVGVRLADARPEG